MPRGGSIELAREMVDEVDKDGDGRVDYNEVCPMQSHAIPCDPMQSMQSHVTPCSLMQPHPVPCSPILLYAVSCDPMQPHAAPCDPCDHMQPHAAHILKAKPLIVGRQVADN